jgi:hypothetical protein
MWRKLRSGGLLDAAGGGYAVEWVAGVVSDTDERHGQLIIGEKAS